MAQPIVTCSDQAVITGRPHLFVLAPTDPVHRFRQMLGNVELIKYDLGFGLWQVAACRVDVRIRILAIQCIPVANKPLINPPMLVSAM